MCATVSACRQAWQPAHTASFGHCMSCSALKCGCCFCCNHRLAPMQCSTWPTYGWSSSRGSSRTARRWTTNKLPWLCWCGAARWPLTFCAVWPPTCPGLLTTWQPARSAPPGCQRRWMESSPSPQRWAAIAAPATATAPVLAAVYVPGAMLCTAAPPPAPGPPAASSALQFDLHDILELQHSAMADGRPKQQQSPAIYCGGYCWWAVSAAAATASCLVCGSKLQPRIAHQGRCCYFLSNSTHCWLAPAP